MNKYYIISLDGKDSFKANTRKEAIELAEKESFNEDATIYFICETDKRVFRKMVEVILV